MPAVQVEVTQSTVSEVAWRVMAREFKMSCYVARIYARRRTLLRCEATLQVTEMMAAWYGRQSAARRQSAIMAAREEDERARAWRVRFFKRRLLPMKIAASYAAFHAALRYSDSAGAIARGRRATTAITEDARRERSARHRPRLCVFKEEERL